MNKVISRYISKNILAPAYLETKPSSKVQIIVVIPCHNEHHLYDSLAALNKCDDPKVDVEVIISINASASDPIFVKRQNELCFQDIVIANDESPSWLSFHGISNNELPVKKAGVGLGRKLGMDEAVRRFIDIDREDGIIVCFDADSQCESNYFVEIVSHFKKQGVKSASIHYEHPIESEVYDSEVMTAIVAYELHLRYFIQMQKSIGLPYAYHTIGSSMACTVEAYCEVGGMNQRKAGEDFYFIHKMIKNGGHSELNTTKVIPSPRISDRVPFGTGKAVGDMVSGGDLDYMTYAPRSFEDLSVFVLRVKEFYKIQRFPEDLPHSIMTYLQSINASKNLDEILSNTRDYPSFDKRFWRWFDAFQLMKCLHYLRDNFYPNVGVSHAVLESKLSTETDVKKQLLDLRLRDIGKSSA